MNPKESDVILGKEKLKLWYIKKSPCISDLIRKYCIRFDVKLIVKFLATGDQQSTLGVFPSLTSE